MIQSDIYSGFFICTAKDGWIILDRSAFNGIAVSVNHLECPVGINSKGILTVFVDSRCKIISQEYIVSSQRSICLI